MKDNIVLERYDINKTYSNIKTFNCGNEIVNKIPQNLAKQVRDGNIAAYLIIDLNHEQKDFIAAFYTISAFSIAKAGFDIAIANTPTNIPCLRLGMLGVDLKYQGKKFGSQLMNHALRLTIKQAESVGIRGLYLDAADGKHDFYGKLGFKAVKSANEQNVVPMFLGIDTIKKAFC